MTAAAHTLTVPTASKEPAMTNTLIEAPGPAVRSTGASVPSLVGLEIRKSLSTRSGKSLAAASILLAPAAAAVAATASSEPLGSVTGPLGALGMLTGLVLLSFGVLSTAGEWSHRTVQTTYLLVPHRGRVLATKAVAVALMGAAFAAMAAALVAGVLALLVSGASWAGVGLAFGAVVAAGAAFAVIGAGVGAATANTPAALTGLYLVILGGIPVLRTFKPEIGDKIDPAGATLALAQGQATTQSILILSAWMGVALVAGAVMTRRRQVS
jgi:ABC-2 type transport system permease protein